MEYICHSGGCPGADMMWENEGLKYGIKVLAYSFWNHQQESKNRKILTIPELNEGLAAARIAGRALKKDIDSVIYPYVRNLVSRNWFQVKNSEAIFAVGIFEKDGTFKFVNGGTGWAVQMAIDNKKEVFFFDQDANQWYRYHYSMELFFPISYIPKLTKNFAGIGTRKLNVNGENAIKGILKYNMGI